MNKQRIILSYVMDLPASPEKVFPLLCPVREREWIEPWRCEMVYSDSGLVELDCIFTTEFLDDGPRDTWVVSRHEPPKAIEFVRINPLRSIRYAIRLLEAEADTSRWEWRQVCTALNEAGENFLVGLSQEGFGEEMTVLQTMLAHYLRTGTMFSFTLSETQRV